MFGRVGRVALALIIGTTLLAFAGLIGFRREPPAFDLLGDPYFHTILAFSFKQALLSAVLSIVLGWGLARLLFYTRGLPLRRAFLGLCLLCFVMPSLVLITGLVGLLGGSGVLAPWLPEGWRLYGLPGILIAHVYLNMPFAARVFYLQLQAIPQTGWRLARQLKLRPRQRFALLEWPALRGVLPQTLGFIFVLCFNSFAVVLALGGGPGATTLEVAIYQALKYDFNIPEAVVLAWTQLLLIGALYLFLNLLGRIEWQVPERAGERLVPALRPLWNSVGRLLYGAAWLLLIAPLVVLVPRMLGGLSAGFPWRDVGAAALLTVLLAVLAVSVAVTMAWGILALARTAREQARGRRELLLDWIAGHPLVAPSMVVSVGLYVLFLGWIDLDRWGMVFLVLLNGLLAVPFVYQQLKPRMIRYDAQYQRLARALKLGTGQRLTLEWRFIRPALAAASALALVLAMGDVAVFSIFGRSDMPTLPWLIYRFAGSYHLAEAAFAAAVLLALCALVIGVVGRGARDA